MKRRTRTTAADDRQAELPSLGVVEQFVTALRFHGFETDVERLGEVWVIGLVRGDASYVLQVSPVDAEAVSIATLHEIAAHHDPFVLMTLASAIMGQVGFVRVRFEPTQQLIIVSIDALVPSADFLVRRIDRWLESIDVASSMLFDGLEHFSEPPARTTPKTRRAASSPMVCRLKVTLRGAKPAIWRRIEVPGSTTLPKLHRILQAAMGWQDSHLHCFEIGKVTYGVPDPDFPDGMRNEKTVRLADVIGEKMRFTYVYDFGDDWTHDIVVEDIAAARGGEPSVQLLGGARAAPPEDVGGIGGYRDFVRALSDKRHGEHERMLEWVGGSFDPETFDAEKARRNLTRLR